MSDVKWIKITTSMFDDEKIRLIESMPDKDAILIIWIKLLVQAGKTNASGYIYLNENIPYTDEMLSTLFNRPLSTVRLAIKTFEEFGMIEIDSKGIQVTNWCKHQNIEGLDKIRKQNRIRKQNQRDREKLLQLEDKNSHVTSRDSHATEEDIDKNKNREDIDKSREDIKPEENLPPQMNDENLKRISKAYKENGFGVLFPNAGESLLELSEKYTIEWVEMAMKKAGKLNKRSVGYVEGILKGWQVDGEPNMESKKEKYNGEHVPSYFKKFHYDYGD